MGTCLGFDWFKPNRKSSQKDQDEKRLRNDENEIIIERAMSFKGLPNLGSTCYLNSLFQALYPLDPLREFINKITDNFKDDLTIYCKSLTLSFF